MTALGCVMGWFALIVQLRLMLHNQQTAKPIIEVLINFFSYFTILSNLLVTVCFTFLLLAPASRAGRFFSKASTLTALTVYILVVGIVYNAVLRQIWDPQGMQKIVDELLHLVMPLWMLLFWICYVDKGTLRWANAWPWLIYPALYLLYTLLRGTLTGVYPYPFVDVAELGYGQALLNSGVVCLVFLVLSFIFIAIGRLGKHK